MKTMCGLDKRHQHVDQTYRGVINENDKRQRKMEKVRPWCGQPSDQGWLMNWTGKDCVITIDSVTAILTVTVRIYSAFSNIVMTVIGVGGSSTILSTHNRRCPISLVSNIVKDRYDTQTTHMFWNYKIPHWATVLDLITHKHIISHLNTCNKPK